MELIGVSFQPLYNWGNRLQYPPNRGSLASPYKQSGHFAEEKESLVPVGNQSQPLQSWCFPFKQKYYEYFRTRKFIF
jgi:hypothetical protein